MSAVRGTFSDIRPVKSRGVMQFVIEVPIEEADSALHILGGVPQPSKERWVGIAPIPDQERAALTVPSGAAPFPAPDAPRPPGVAGKPAGAALALKPKRPWRDLPVPMRAALMCSDPASWPVLASLVEGAYSAPKDENEAAELLRELCVVTTRADIKPDNYQFQIFEAEYMRATGRIAAP